MTENGFPVILVCGGRDFTDKQFVCKTLDKLCADREWRTPPDAEGNWMPMANVIHGGARGADSLASYWATINWCHEVIYRPDWSLGRAAGPIRNREMLEKGRPDVVVAFPGGRGTADMVRQARDADVEVVIARHPELAPFRETWQK